MQMNCMVLFKPPAVSATKMCNFLTGISPRQLDQLKYVKAFSTARLLYISLCQDCSVNFIFPCKSAAPVPQRHSLFVVALEGYSSDMHLCIFYCGLPLESVVVAVVSHGTLHVCEMERKKEEAE